ncbi:MAG TPA: flagellin [Gaiellales bacterium]|nr:flagellin [Gaiellales bacterium]
MGANDGETITTNAVKLFGSGAGYAVDSSIFSFSGSTINLSAIDAAIQNVSTDRATFGAVQNRLQHTLNNLGNYQENLSASESSIKDVDMASEMVNFTKLQVLQQAGMSVLSQANQAPQSVLTLLR